MFKTYLNDRPRIGNGIKDELIYDVQSKIWDKTYIELNILIRYIKRELND